MVDPAEYLRIVLDERTLPTVVTPMILRQGEVASPPFAAGGVARTSRPLRRTRRKLHHLETGRLYVTNQRIILSGAANDLSLEYREVEGVAVSDLMLIVQRIGKLDPYLELNSPGWRYYCRSLKRPLPSGTR